MSSTLRPPHKASQPSPPEYIPHPLPHFESLWSKTCTTAINVKWNYVYSVLQFSSHFVFPSVVPFPLFQHMLHNFLSSLLLKIILLTKYSPTSLNQFSSSWSHLKSFPLSSHTINYQTSTHMQSVFTSRQNQFSSPPPSKSSLTPNTHSLTTPTETQISSFYLASTINSPMVFQKTISFIFRQITWISSPYSGDSAGGSHDGKASSSLCILLVPFSDSQIAMSKKVVETSSF